MTRQYRFYEVKRVFLACPGDLMAERSRFPRVLQAVNNLRAHSLGFHCEPVGWERVIPSFGRPRDLINRELQEADLVIVMFWNGIGSASGRDAKVTGTMEEYDLARRLHDERGRPLVWVYFRRPTEDSGEQVEGVLNFRRTLEVGKDVFFREYAEPDEWEEMIREHLVAYLDGLQRWDVDRTKEQMRPERALLHGSFVAEGIWEPGHQLTFAVDLDANGVDELVQFRMDFHGFHLKIDGCELAFPETWDDENRPVSKALDSAKTIHIAFCDVNGDGRTEILLAAHDGAAIMQMAVWGIDGKDRSWYTILGAMDGQQHAYVQPGSISLPYGTVGLATLYNWNGAAFESGWTTSYPYSGIGTPL